MKLLNKVRISLLIAFFIIIISGVKAFAVTGVITEITVNLREKPSTDSKKIMYVTQDDEVEVLEKVEDWYKIKFNNTTGYVFGEYLKVDDSKLEQETETSRQTQEEESDTATKQEETIDKDEDKELQDVTTDIPVELEIKENTDIRLIPNITSSIIYTAKKQISVNVIEQLDEWSYVSVDNILGWVRTDNIVEKDSVETTQSNETSSNTESKKAYIKYDTVNLRKKASTSAIILAKLKLNDEVEVLEKVNSTWSKIKVDGQVGYVSTDLLADEKQKEKEETETTSRDGESTSREETEVETNTKVEETSKKEEKTKTSTITSKEIETQEKKTTTTSSSKTKGEEIVEYAKKYLGYDYKYGGTSPKTGFDCSGFTYYVYKNFGYTISRSSSAQAKNGKEVAKKDLQPGDLVIYKNTSLTKIGHVGIYIGNNKMIHASEPGVGVTITDIDSKAHNYPKRYVTARRII